jgi:hypothetical protein
MSLTRPSVPWRHGVLQQIDDLGRWFGGRVLAAADPSDELVAGRDLLDPDRLRAAIARSVVATVDRPPPGSDERPAETGSEGDDLGLRVAASRFARHYSASLTAVALVGLSRGVGLDLAAERCTLVVRHDLPWALVLDPFDDEALLCSERPSPWEVSGPVVDTLEQLRHHVWRKLYAENLWPVLELVVQIGQIAPGVVWTNAAEWPALVGTSAIEYLGVEEAEPFVAESNAVLGATSLPGIPAHANPLADRFDWVPGDGRGFPETVQTRKRCCLTYLSADRFGRLCQSCPYLPLPDRIALVRERHGVPMGTPGGAAEKRSIEAGLDRPSTRHAVAKSARS